MNFLRKWKAGTRMREYDVIILPLAEKDIINNVDYIFYDKKSPETAMCLMDGFYKTIEKLSYMPEQHEVDEDEELSKRNIHKCYYKNYKIFFYINKEQYKVYILRVLHMLVDAKSILLDMVF